MVTGLNVRRVSGDYEFPASWQSVEGKDLLKGRKQQYEIQLIGIKTSHRSLSHTDLTLEPWALAL